MTIAGAGDDVFTVERTEVKEDMNGFLNCRLTRHKTPNGHIYSL